MARLLMARRAVRSAKAEMCEGSSLLSRVSLPTSTLAAQDDHKPFLGHVQGGNANYALEPSSMGLLGCEKSLNEVLYKHLAVAQIRGYGSAEGILTVSNIELPNTKSCTRNPPTV